MLPPDQYVLSDTEIKEIVLADGELAGFAFVAGEEVAGLVTPLLARRVASCLDAVAAGTAPARIRQHSAVRRAFHAPTSHSGAVSRRTR